MVVILSPMCSSNLSSSTGQHGVDTAHGRADPGVGGPASTGLVAEHALHGVYLGEGLLEPAGSLHEGESHACCSGGVAGCATGEEEREEIGVGWMIGEEGRLELGWKERGIELELGCKVGEGKSDWSGEISNCQVVLSSMWVCMNEGMNCMW